MSSSNKLIIIGIGNEFRNDDGIGIFVTGKLREKFGDDVYIITNNGDGTSLIDSWKGYDKAILIDAIYPLSDKNREPEELIHVFDLNSNKLTKDKKFSASHLFGVYDAIETSRVLGILPSEVLIYGIEGLDFSYGNKLSVIVTEAGNKVIEMISREILHEEELA